MKKAFSESLMRRKNRLSFSLKSSSAFTTNQQGIYSTNGIGRHFKWDGFLNGKSYSTLKNSCKVEKIRIIEDIPDASEEKIKQLLDKFEVYCKYIEKKENKPRSQITIVVGMSGGVDSSMTACLLKEFGFNVVSLHMR